MSRCRPQRPGTLYRAGKFVRRHRAGLGTAALLLSLLVAGVVVSVWLAVRANQARARAQRMEGEARENLWASYLATARASRLSGQPGRRFAALEAAAKAAAIRPTIELRSEAASAMALVDLRPIRELTQSPGQRDVGCRPRSEVRVLCLRGSVWQPERSPRER